MSAPRLLFLGRVDYANLCNRIARAINAHVGERVARVFTQEPHPFSTQRRFPQGGYLEDRVEDAAHLATLAAEADWLISTGDGDYGQLVFFLDRLRNPRQSLALTHAGTAYREHPHRYNRVDAGLGAKLRFIGCDSLHLAAHDPAARPYFGTCYEPGEAPLAYREAPRAQPLRVTHSPTTRAKKGTDEILPVLHQLATANEIVLDLIEGVSPAEALVRRAQAHVHVDQLNPAVGGFGQSAIEALGAGCCTLADMRFVSTGGYVDRPPIIDVRTGQELKEWLQLLGRERDVLETYRQDSLRWAQRFAAPEAVARYWLAQLS